MLDKNSTALLRAASRSPIKWRQLNAFDRDACDAMVRLLYMRFDGTVFHATKKGRDELTNPSKKT